MRIGCIQMDMKLGNPKYNFTHAQDLVREAALEKPHVVVLPETWNTGFFPRENLAALSDHEGKRTKEIFGPLAKELGIHIVAGSVANRQGSEVFNTALVFHREGTCLAEYDKTHLFTLMGEQECFVRGNHLSRFSLDGVSCGIVICYDIRFPELIRSLALRGMEVLFVVSQWPEMRIPHLNVLSQARAIENQMFVVVCNSCGTAGETRYGGNSSLIDPWGKVLRRGGTGEEIVTANCDLGIIKEIRNSINVFRDRRAELYRTDLQG